MHGVISEMLAVVLSIVLISSFTILSVLIVIENRKLIRIDKDSDLKRFD